MAARKESTTALATITPTLDRESESILNASDDRDLIAQGQDDFLPYDLEFDIGVEILEVRPKKNHDSRGVFVTLRVTESNAPAEVQVGKTYVLAFFDAHKTIPEFVIGTMIKQRRAFAAAVAGTVDSPDFRAADVLIPLVREIEPLGIAMRLTSNFVRNTRNGKAIHTLKFALA